MSKRLDEILELMSEEISESDIIAAEHLAKISAVIAKRRIEMEMTQKDFADFMGVSQSMISKWENDDCNFTIETLVEICQKLDYELEINIKPKKEEVGRKLNDDWVCFYKNSKTFGGVA